MYGYRQEHHAEAGGMGKAARPQSGAQDHYPQGHAGTVSDGWSYVKKKYKLNMPFLVLSYPAKASALLSNAA